MTKPDDRERILTKIRNLKMARSAHAYVRGTTVKFYEWLENSSRAKVPEGPPVWICGDCHVGNLGPLADAKGHVLIQIRDLDQTVIGNPAHDLVRLGLSLASAARGSDLPGVTTARILEGLVAGYQSALSGDFETDMNKAHRPKSIQTLLAQSTRRRWRHLAEERLDTVTPTIPCLLYTSIPSPTMPNTKGAPHAISVSIKISDVFMSSDGDGISVIAVCVSERLSAAATGRSDAKPAALTALIAPPAS